MIKGISRHKLCDYVATRQKIDVELQLIYSLSHLLAGFEKNSVDSNMELDPVALGHVNQIINKSVLDIWEILDDFIYLVQAKTELNQYDD